MDKVFSLRRRSRTTKDCTVWRRAAPTRESVFNIHLAAYVVINLMLVAINLSGSAAVFWFMYPLVGWGAGLLIHGMIVFALVGAGLKDRLVNEELNRLRGSR